MTYVSLMWSNKDVGSLVEILKQDSSLIPSQTGNGFNYKDKISIGIDIRLPDRDDCRRWSDAQSLIEFYEFEVEHPSKEYLDLYHKLKHQIGEFRWVNAWPTKESEVILSEEPTELRR